MRQYAPAKRRAIAEEVDVAWTLQSATPKQAGAKRGGLPTLGDV